MVNKKRILWLGLLVLIGIAYIYFHQVRGDLAFSFFKNSFPSFLVPLVMFGSVELIEDIKFKTKKIKLLLLSFTLIIAILWFEVGVPLFYEKSTGDWSDAAAMVLGFVAYWAVSSAFERCVRV